jgi:anti-sigma B factor antagonist
MGGLDMAARASSPAAGGRMFVAATEQLDRGTHVVRVMGEVDLATVKELKQALHDARVSRTGAVIVDLTGCTFLDSSGLRALLETRERLERASRRLALVLSTPGVLRIFQITALDDVFEIHPSLGAAVDVDGAGIALGDQVG